MNLKEYIEINLWNKIDYDKVYNYQCCDLIKDFAHRVLSLPLGSCNWSAKNLIEKKINGYEKFLNTPEWIPKPWSIIVWKWWPYEKYGHTAIVVKAGVNKLEVLEQNALWTGDWNWENAIRLHTYNYNYIAGWFTKIEKEKSFFTKLQELSLNQIIVLYQKWVFINDNWKKTKINIDNIDKYV